MLVEHQRHAPVEPVANIGYGERQRQGFVSHHEPRTNYQKGADLHRRIVVRGNIAYDCVKSFHAQRIAADLAAYCSQTVRKGSLGNVDQGPLRNAESTERLLSQAISHQVPSAHMGLTSGFGMGPGVTPQL